MTTEQMKAVHTPANTNALNAPTLNVLGMPTAVKLTHGQTYGQFSCVEVDLAPRQMGPPPHVHYELDEIMRVLEGTVTVLEGDKAVEVAAGGWHFRPRGVVHTFGMDTMRLPNLLICIRAPRILPIIWKNWHNSLKIW
nr:cupin domain-containing protein [Haliscomenobacter sp.]